MERVLLYVHFNKLGRVSDHVFYQLEQIKPIFSRILFISNSPLDTGARKKLQEELGISDLLERENRGFDFAAWREGMEFLGFESLKNYQSLTLMNDTCFGPLWSLEELYQEFEQDGQVDFWGMTNFRKTKYFPEHLQSYFLSFKQAVLRDEAFKRFWSQVENFQDVQKVIDRYETQFTAYFQKAGYRYKAVFDTRQEAAEDLIHPDFSYYKPQQILERRLPLLKVKAVQGHPFLAPYLLRLIEEHSAYPTHLIKKHVFDFIQPDAAFLLQDKCLAAGGQAFEPEKKTALHIHVTDMALFARYREALFALPFQLDYLLTAASQTILSQLERDLADSGRSYQFILSQQENPLLVLFSQRELLQGYASIGHLSTQALIEGSPAADAEMRDDLFQMMLENASASLQRLEGEARLGLVIPDLPRAVRLGQLREKDQDLRAKMQAVWEELGCQKQLPLDSSGIFTRVYGGFLWFKYPALESLFDLAGGLFAPLFLSDPSAIWEHLLVYVAWDRNYDFNIMSSDLLPALLDRQRRAADLMRQKEKLSPKSFLARMRGRLSALLNLK